MYTAYGGKKNIDSHETHHSKHWRNRPAVNTASIVVLSEIITDSELSEAKMSILTLFLYSIWGYKN